MRAQRSQLLSGSAQGLKVKALNKGPRAPGDSILVSAQYKYRRCRARGRAPCRVPPASTYAIGV
jgi:hypothetical protein